MLCDHMQGVIQRIAQAPWEHQIQYIVHLSSKHRSDCRGEHGEALEERSLERSILLPEFMVSTGKLSSTAGLTLSVANDL